MSVCTVITAGRRTGNDFLNSMNMFIFNTFRMRTDSQERQQTAKAKTAGLFLLFSLLQCLLDYKKYKGTGYQSKNLNKHVFKCYKSFLVFSLVDCDSHGNVLIVHQVLYSYLRLQITAVWSKAKGKINKPKQCRADRLTGVTSDNNLTMRSWYF